METQVDSLSHMKNAARVAREEAELQELLKQAGVLTDENDDDGVQQEAAEEVTEEAPRVEEPDEPEERKAETKEEDTEELSAEEKTFKQRYSDIRKYMQEKEAEHKAELEKIKSQLDKATKNELVLPKTDKEIEAWAKKYPDVAAIVEAIADKKASEKASTLDSRLKEIEAMRMEATREKAEAELLRRHPDFYDLRDDDAFHNWAEKQSKALQKALYEDPDNVEDVAWAIDMYKTAKGIKTKPATNTDKSAASSVKSKRTAPSTEGKTWRESEIAKLSDADYEKYQDEIFKAQAEKRFIYDVSKK